MCALSFLLEYQKPVWRILYFFVLFSHFLVTEAYLSILVITIKSPTPSNQRSLFTSSCMFWRGSLTGKHDLRKHAYAGK